MDERHEDDKRKEDRREEQREAERREEAEQERRAEQAQRKIYAEQDRTKGADADRRDAEQERRAEQDRIQGADAEMNTEASALGVHVPISAVHNPDPFGIGRTVNHTISQYQNRPSNPFNAAGGGNPNYEFGKMDKYEFDALIDSAIAERKERNNSAIAERKKRKWKTPLIAGEHRIQYGTLGIPRFDRDTRSHLFDAPETDFMSSEFILELWQNYVNRAVSGTTLDEGEGPPEYVWFRPPPPQGPPPPPPPPQQGPQGPPPPPPPPWPHLF